MSEKTHFGKVTKLQQFCALVALFIGCFFEASWDFLKAQTPPSMTLDAILMDTVMILAVGLVLGIPVTMLFWNRLVAPIFEVRKIRYVHGLVVATVLYWLSGI